VRDTPETDAKTTEYRSVEVEITSKRWGSDQTPSIKTIEVPIIGESTVRLDITVDLRKIDSMVIRPVRRDMDDVEGMLADAKMLADD